MSNAPAVHQPSRQPAPHQDGAKVIEASLKAALCARWRDAEVWRVLAVHGGSLLRCLDHASKILFSCNSRLRSVVIRDSMLCT